jgi:DNA-directed RNA polymerase subunit alpha
MSTLVDELTPRVETVHMSADFGRFQVEPLPPGFGLTLGNALRRVLLSSLPGAAITAMKVDNIYHEFATMPGVREDTTELILNVKQIRLKSYSAEPVRLQLQASGPGVITAGDISCPADVEIANPELYIATLDSAEARLDVEFTVERGEGYITADGREAPAIGVIPVDAVFTPIRRVNYQVEHTRVGPRTDLDRLTIEVQTDGTIAPNDALAQAGQLLIQQFAIFTDLSQTGRRPEKATLVAGAISPRIYDMPIEQLELSSRTYNCLKRSQITKVGQILEMSEDELLALRNFGHKSLTELRERLEALGVSLDSGEAREGEEDDDEALVGGRMRDDFEDDDITGLDDDIEGDRYAYARVNEEEEQ